MAQSLIIERIDYEAMPEVITARMRLVSGTRVLAEAELGDHARLSQLLPATVPAEWPPEDLREALPMFLSRCRESGNFGPWTLGWYGLLALDGEAVLCGSVGFKGEPNLVGVVEIGYAVIQSYQGRGIATEMVRGLSNWAFGQPGIQEIQAEVLPQNLASLRVLAMAGFVPMGPHSENGMLRFRRSGQNRTPQLILDGPTWS